MILTRIGQQFGGGYFTGINRIGTIAYAIIVAPERSHSAIELKTSDSPSGGTQSVNNGLANTAAMNNAEHPAAQYCRSLTVGSYTDWYLPSRDELEMCYRYLKPTTENNFSYAARDYLGNLGLANGTNLNSIPTGVLYTDDNPSQTIVTAFCAGNGDAFNDDWYWTSTESSTNANTSLCQDFSDGGQSCDFKTNVLRVRAVRREVIYGESN